MPNALRDSLINEMMDKIYSEDAVRSFVDSARAAVKSEGLDVSDDMVAVAVCECLASHARSMVEEVVDEQLAQLPWYGDYQAGQAALNYGFLAINDAGEAEFTPHGFFIMSGRVGYSDEDRNGAALNVFDRLLEEAHRRGFKHAAELRRAFALETDPLKDAPMRELCLSAVAAIGEERVFEFC